MNCIDVGKISLKLSLIYAVKMVGGFTVSLGGPQILLISGAIGLIVAE